MQTAVYQPLPSYHDDPEKALLPSASGCDSTQGPASERRRWSSHWVPKWSVVVVLLIRISALTWIVYTLWRYCFPHFLAFEGADDHTGIPEFGLPESVMRKWAQYAPYMPVDPYIAPPLGCAVTQVRFLQRHGARWPTESAGKEMKTAVDKLLAVKKYKDENLDFLHNFTWTFGQDDLLPFGAAQSFDAGRTAYERYSHLFSNESLPFVRAASAGRVVDSSTNWTAGCQKTIDAKLDLILPESVGGHGPMVPLRQPDSYQGNLTLNDNMCPNSGDGDDESAKWLAVYAPPITARLNAGAPGADLTHKDAHHLMTMCPFHTQVEQLASPFCALFTNHEFKAYEYFADVNKFYGNGYGDRLGRVQGVGYVNELLARLTNTPVHDNTQTNRTLDASPETFPLNRTFYADFSHDNTMVAIYAALGLFKDPLPLDPTTLNPVRRWVISEMVPFSARIVVERLECAERLPIPRPTMVRILVNDAVQPLEFCGGVAGMCTLDAFVKSQSYARHDGDGDWDLCSE
ncbi:phosphoglycerate mutase-like protein [Artomyces pyxidatus]|uniref:Phosphoglycerate mutase-like protein n=1 Tax=Artomyces pyxidatus TaxID=48021 RepID=A0ACB8T3V3_9AGAM|nr:phosphoglycerate mutase-like protein [Artomyces pyxidatus]